MLSLDKARERCLMEQSESTANAFDHASQVHRHRRNHWLARPTRTYLPRKWPRTSKRKRQTAKNIVTSRAGSRTLSSDLSYTDNFTYGRTGDKHMRQSPSCASSFFSCFFFIPTGIWMHASGMLPLASEKNQSNHNSNPPMIQPHRQFGPVSFEISWHCHSLPPHSRWHRQQSPLPQGHL